MAKENVFYVKNYQNYVKDFTDKEVHFTNNKEEAIHFLKNAFTAFQKKFSTYYFYQEPILRINYRVLLSLQRMYTAFAPVQRGEYDIFVHGTVKSIIITKTLKVGIELNTTKKDKIYLNCDDALETQVRALKIGQKIKATGTVNLAKSTSIKCSIIQNIEEKAQVKQLPEAKPTVETNTATTNSWVASTLELDMLQFFVKHPEEYEIETQTERIVSIVHKSYDTEHPINTKMLLYQRGTIFYTIAPTKEIIPMNIVFDLVFQRASQFNQYFEEYHIPCHVDANGFFTILRDVNKTA